MSYADAWLRWFDIVELGAGPLSQRMIEMGEVTNADRVLDIGTGIGEPALTVAQRLGSKGRVLAIDSDAEMIAIAQVRARSAGIANVDFEIAEIESLELDSDSFDCVLARWSLMFARDLPQIFSRLNRALRTGGRLVLAVWADAEAVPALTLARRVVHEHFGWPPLVYGPGTPFALADVAATGQLLTDAGFREVRDETVPVIYRYPSFDAYLQNRLDLTGPLWDGMETVPQAERDAAFAAIRTALEPYRAAAGDYAITNSAICISAVAG